MDGIVGSALVVEDFVVLEEDVGDEGESSVGDSGEGEGRVGGRR